MIALLNFKVILGSAGATLSDAEIGYQLSNDADGQLNRAFDILFEETLRQMTDLTAKDS